MPFRRPFYDQFVWFRCISHPFSACFSGNLSPCCFAEQLLICSVGCGDAPFFVFATAKINEPLWSGKFAFALETATGSSSLMLALVVSFAPFTISACLLVGLVVASKGGNYLATCSLLRFLRLHPTFFSRAQQHLQFAHVPACVSGVKDMCTCSVKKFTVYEDTKCRGSINFQAFCSNETLGQQLKYKISAFRVARSLVCGKPCMPRHLMAKRRPAKSLRPSPCDIAFFAIREKKRLLLSSQRLAGIVSEVRMSAQG